MLGDPRHESHQEMKEWVESMNEGAFDPEAFEPSEVEFMDPKERFNLAFGS